jgi:hypothetical protein
MFYYLPVFTGQQNLFSGHSNVQVGSGFYDIFTDPKHCTGTLKNV